MTSVMKVCVEFNKLRKDKDMSLKELILKNHTQRSFAKKVGVSEGMICHLLAGRRVPSYHLMQKIKSACDCDYNTIVEALNDTYERKEL